MSRLYETYTNLGSLIFCGVAISGMTLTDEELYSLLATTNYQPSINIEYQDVEILRDNYRLLSHDVSNDTYTLTQDFMDYFVIKKFAEKFIKEVATVDPDIQSVVDDYYWEML